MVGIDAVLQELRPCPCSGLVGTRDMTFGNACGKVRPRGMHAVERHWKM